MTNMNINNHVRLVPRDRRVTMGGRIASIHVQCISLTDELNLAQLLKPTSIFSSINDPDTALSTVGRQFFDDCAEFIDDCEPENLPKFSVEACLYYARVARSYQSYCHAVSSNVDEASKHINTAKKLLEKANELCAQPFENAEGLRHAVEDSIRLLGREWYAPVSAEEIAAIKNAMVSGAGGLATHSGHWYNYVNGHPVSTYILSPSRESDTGVLLVCNR